MNSNTRLNKNLERKSYVIRINVKIGTVSAIKKKKPIISADLILNQYYIYFSKNKF